MRRRATLLLATALAVVPADAALAGGARVEGGTVWFDTTRAEVNRVTVFADAQPGILIEDDENDVRPGPGCVGLAPRRVRCGDSTTTLLRIDTGPAADLVTLRSSLPVRAEVHGGSGNDMIRSGPLDDLLVGGRGGDTVSYVSRAEDVRVTLAGGANDGRAGEGDDVREMEGVVGGNGFDTLIGADTYGDLLTGGPGDDRLEGLGGADRLVGGPGNDLLEGGPGSDVFGASATPDGSDTLRGGPGDDRADYRRRRPGVVVDPDGRADDGTRPGGELRFLSPLPPLSGFSSDERDNVLPDVENLRGGHGSDVLALGPGGGRLDGGAGTDVLYGGSGRDTLSGGTGFDRIVARDRAADVVDCGAQVDRVFSRRGDSISNNCEQRSIRVPMRVSVATRSLSARGLRVRVTCPSQAYIRCAGRLRAMTVKRLRRVRGRSRPVPLGGARLNGFPGATTDVVIPVGRVGRRLIARNGRLRIRVVLRGRDNAGPGPPAKTVLTLVH